MYKFYISRHLPFWGYNTENKPSPKVLGEFVNTMEQVEKIGISNITPFGLTLTCGINDIKYIKIENTNNGEVKYYFIDSIQQITTNTSYYVYNCLLDVFCTYTMQFINDNIDKELIFLRQDQYDEKCLQLDDTFINSIPKIYESFEFEKKLYNYDEKEKIWYGNNAGIYENGDLVNANKYFVFSNGSNGGYRFYPVMSNARDVDFNYNDLKPTNKILYEKIFSYGRRRNYIDDIDEEIVDIESELNKKIFDAYNNNKVVKFQFRHLRKDGHVTDIWAENLWRDIPNVAIGALPKDFYTSVYMGEHRGLGIRYMDVYMTYNGQEYWSRKLPGIIVPAINKMNDVALDLIKKRVVIYETEKTTKKIKLKNSFASLDLLRKDEQYINKFVGIYYLPHILNFDYKWFNFDKDNTYLYIEIPSKGKDIDNYDVYSYELSNIENKLNNSTFSTPYLLKYILIKYYGNFINSEYRYNNNHNIYIFGKLIFTDTCNIISKENKLLSLENSIISWPYQLPYGVSTYEQYLKANREVTDTSFAIEHQKYSRNFAMGLFNGIYNHFDNAAQTFTNTTGNALKGNVGGIVKDIGKGVSQQNKNIINTVSSLVFAGQDFDNMKNKIRAQYSQAQKTMGNNIINSGMQSASLIKYYDSELGEQTQFEGVEIAKLSKESLININNIIFFYGYLLPNKSTFNKKFTELLQSEKEFIFLQVDATLLELRANLIINSNITNDIYTLIKEQLENGIRIWNKDNIYELPVYDNNMVWPNQPNPDDIYEPKPPVDNDITSYTIEGELWTNHCAIEGQSVNLSIVISPDTEQLGIAWTSYKGAACMDQESYLFDEGIRKVKINFALEQCKGDGIIDNKRIAILTNDKLKNNITLYIPKNIGYVLWNPFTREPAKGDNITIYEQ